MTDTTTPQGIDPKSIELGDSVASLEHLLNDPEALASLQPTEDGGDA